MRYRDDEGPRRAAFGTWAVLGIILMIVGVGCARTPDLVGVDNPVRPVASVQGVDLQKIFLMTTRQASEFVNVFYTNERAPELGLASLTVSIPPNHVPGELEAPKSLPPDPRTEFAVVDPVVYGNDTAFVASINRELAKRAPVDRNILFFVHGYNNTTSESILRMAQFVEDTGFNGVPVLFAWASGAEATRYVYDLNSALVARAQLEPTFNILARSNARIVDVFAHSMGSFLIMEGLVQADLANRFNKTDRLGSIILASPDIDVDLFRAQLDQIETDFSKIYVLISDDDRVLRLSQRLSGGVSRVGATHAEDLAELGVVAIDLSEVDDSAAGSHTKFAGSPEVVQLLGEGLNAQKYNPSAGLGPIENLLTGLPIRVVVD